MEKCVERLTLVVFHVDVEDPWLWNLHPSSYYTVIDAYNNLFEVDNNNQSNFCIFD